MIVFHFPPAANAETAAFSVVGQAYPSGSAEGELLLIPPGAPDSVPDCFRGCVFYLDSTRVFHLPFCARTLLPEALATGAPGNPVYVSSRLSGGTLRARLSSAHEHFGDRLWLVIAPLSHFFALPCPSGDGVPVPETALCAPGESFFSGALCCHCRPALWRGARGLYLFDTEQSIREKLALAGQCGILNALVLPSEPFSSSCRKPPSTDGACLDTLI